MTWSQENSHLFFFKSNMIPKSFNLTKIQFPYFKATNFLFQHPIIRHIGKKISLISYLMRKRSGIYLLCTQFSYIYDQVTSCTLSV